MATKRPRKPWAGDTVTFDSSIFRQSPCSLMEKAPISEVGVASPILARETMLL
jgi:hypothetical protein